MTPLPYDGYTAHIHTGGDHSAAEAKGAALRGAFPGIHFDIVPGEVCGQCTEVDGQDPERVKQIRLWLNSTP